MSSFFLPIDVCGRYDERCSVVFWGREQRGARAVLTLHRMWSGEAASVTIQINGEVREVPEGLNLAALIEWLKLPRDRVAVERNLEIVARADWNVTPVQAGDRLEVVHLVGGGA